MTISRDWPWGLKMGFSDPCCCYGSNPLGKDHRLDSNNNCMNLSVTASSSKVCQAEEARGRRVFKGGNCGDLIVWSIQLSENLLSLPSGVRDSLSPL